MGAIHTMLLPVPPIYAGASGEPGLILPDSCVAPDAPGGTIEALIDAAENDLLAAGSQIILSSLVTGGEWRTAFRQGEYKPLTLYLSRTALGRGKTISGVRPALGDPSRCGYTV